MKHFLILFVAMWVGAAGLAQDVNVLMKEAQNLERTQKETEALQKYVAILALDSKNMRALVRASELSSAIGARQKDKKDRLNYFQNAKGYAEAALIVDSNNADANYVRAVVAGKFTEVETDNKKIVENVRDTKVYADKALSINPNHARANYVVGKWHYEMVTLAWAKRAAVKLFYGGLPSATIEDAFKYMEKARSADQYFVLNYLDLAKAYKYDNKPAKAIEVLNKLVKLPTRTADDVALKEEGRAMLNEMQ